jgi:hypothetical protein
MQNVGIASALFTTSGQVFLWSTQLKENGEQIEFGTYPPKNFAQREFGDYAGFFKVMKFRFSNSISNRSEDLNTTPFSKSRLLAKQEAAGSSAVRPAKAPAIKE